MGIWWDVFREWLAGGLIEELLEESGAEGGGGAGGGLVRPPGGLVLPPKSSAPGGGGSGIVGAGVSPAAIQFPEVWAIKPKQAADLTITLEEAHGPVGWLGALAAYAHACLAWECSYMLGKSHAAPWKTWRFAKKYTVNSDVDDWHLITNRFRGAPSPVHPACGCDLLATDLEANSWHWWSTWFHDMLERDDFWSAQAEAAARQPCDGIDRLPIPTAETSPSNSLYTVWRVKSDGTLLRGQGGEYRVVYPALGPRGAAPPGDDLFDSSTRWRWRKLYNCRQETISAQEHVGAAPRPIVVPPHWRASQARLNEYVRRLARWFYTSQALVWALERMRTESDYPREVPADWRHHCLAWGIIPAKSLSSEQRYSDDDGAEYLRTKWTRAQWETVAWILMRHTPPPGTLGASGGQIAVPGVRRALCDIPDEAGSAAPPIRLATSTGLRWWTVSAYGAIEGHRPNWGGYDTAALALQLFSSVCSTIAGCCGTSAANSAVSAVQVATAAAMQTSLVVFNCAGGLLQRARDIAARGGDVSAGDIVGLLSEAASLAGVVAEEINIVPPQVWSAIEQGAELVKVAGVDWDLVKGKFEMVQALVQGIKGGSINYPYIEDLFFGIGFAPEWDL